MNDALESNFKGKDASEAYNLIDDLKKELSLAQKSNSTLRNKLNYYKSIQEADVRKRTGVPSSAVNERES
jgi:hypothetical protein